MAWCRLTSGFLCAIILCALPGCAPSGPTMLGRFDVDRDLFLAHFDSKTDVDDLHSIAGVATVLADARFADVRYHAVAGAYGIQKGLYVPANELFEAAFGENWSDAHSDYDAALAKVSAMVVSTLQGGGSVWIAEAGQSDFSADVVEAATSSLGEPSLSGRVNVVQHSDWNESVTSEASLELVKTLGTYHRIPDGNAEGNGTPGFRSESEVEWRASLLDSDLTQLWEQAIEIADRYNGVDGRYLNEAIAAGGLDFSDVSETCWIFGFGDLADTQAFFEEFGE